VVIAILLKLVFWNIKTSINIRNWSW